MSDGPFLRAARVETMLRDIDRLRRAIRTEHDIEAAEVALDKCERWFDQLKPGDRQMSEAP
jgi:hypothetical protein